MNLITVLHKARAFIGNRIYEPGDTATIAADQFSPEVHDILTAPADTLEPPAITDTATADAVAQAQADAKP